MRCVSVIAMGKLLAGRQYSPERKDAACDVDHSSAGCCDVPVRATSIPRSGYGTDRVGICGWMSGGATTADCCGSAFTQKPLLVGDYRGCERHRFGRTVDTLQAGVLEAFPPRPEDPHHLPNSRRRATRPDDAITLSNFDLYACAHDGPFRDTATACRSGRFRDPMHRA